LLPERQSSWIRIRTREFWSHISAVWFSNGDRNLLQPPLENQGELCVGTAMSALAVVLIVEDREDDIFLVRRAFKAAFLDNPLHVVRNGEEAIAYLQGKGRYSNRVEHPLPGLILLDLKMPGMDGFDVLTWIRQQPGICAIPVVVLTSSDQIKDVNRAYTLGANSFLVKPLDFQNYTQLTRLINQYWIETSKSPQTYREEKTLKSKPQAEP